MARAGRFRKLHGLTMGDAVEIRAELGFLVSLMGGGGGCSIEIEDRLITTRAVAGARLVRLRIVQHGDLLGLSGGCSAGGSGDCIVAGNLDAIVPGDGRIHRIPDILAGRLLEYGIGQVGDKADGTAEQGAASEFGCSRLRIAGQIFVNR